MWTITEYLLIRCSLYRFGSRYVSWNDEKYDDEFFCLMEVFFMSDKSRKLAGKQGKKNEVLDVVVSGIELTL